MSQARRRLAITGVAVALAVAAALLTSPSIGDAADHLDAPLVQLDGRTDINDVYVFQSPDNSDNTVLIMTVNPVAGVLSDTTFDPRARYEFLIDRDGDAEADTTYRIRFDDPDDDDDDDDDGDDDDEAEVAEQEYKLRTKGPRPRLRAEGETGGTESIRGGGMITAGVFEDPFFFDLNGFSDGLDFTGDDFFAGLNVSAIVLEVPSSALGEPGDTIGVWARTVVRGRQIDRMGRPAINTVLIPSDQKDAFNASAPAQDQANFRDEVVATITALSNAGNAEALADILLPDVNTYTIGDSSGFLNGRQLADDVIDAALGLLTAGAVTGDGVDGNDVAFLNPFPYLAPAN